MSFGRMRATLSRREVRGFSLIELMVAVTLSLLLLAGVIAIFTSSRASYETTDKLSRIQENGRFALDEIAAQIRGAGFVGCARQPNNLATTLNSNTDLTWDFLSGPVRGYQYVSAGTWAPALHASVVTPADGSDVLVLRAPEAGSTSLILSADMATGADPITVTPSATSGLNAGDVALVYSCESQAYVYVTSFAGGVVQHAAVGTVPGNATNDMGVTFRRNAQIVPVETVVYYVRRSTAAEAGIGPADATSLYRRIGANAPEELVEGVQSMQVQFGVDTTGDAVVDNYFDANAVPNWDNVYTVTVALLVRSLEEYGGQQDAQTYQLLDTTVPAANDRRIRQIFTTTASLRNRVPVN